MYTCSTGKFSQYFEDHHFKLKLNRNAGWYKRLILFCTLVTFGIFLSKKHLWNKRAFIFLEKVLAAKIYLIYFLDKNPQKSPLCLSMSLSCTTNWWENEAQSKSAWYQKVQIKALPDITSGPEVWQFFKIRTVWKLDVFLP